jgi:predicted AAA+ superfamily ATPase
MYRHRTLEAYLKRAGAQFPVLLVTGPRQVGKTTVLQHLSEKDRKYISLDDPGIALLARQEPNLFLQRFSPPILIDEIQYAPELLPFIKLYVDKHKRMGDFWLTGSQQFQLMHGVSESLAGRVGIVQLLGLSLKERQKDTESDEPFLPIPDRLEKRFKSSQPLALKEIYQIIWQGSFPALDLNPLIDRDLFYSSYVQTYLQRDVRDLARVGDEGAFLKFLRAAAARTSQLLNLSDLARDVGISAVTAKHWLSILETSGIVYLLEPYHTNITKRLIKSPKLHFLDTGLAAYLTEWSSPETLEAGAMSGNILETFVFTEILKSYWHNGKQAPLYFYRDKDKKEIDLLIIQDRIIYPIECKKTGFPNSDALRPFRTLENLKNPIGEAAVICLCDMLLPITKHIQAVPVFSL